MRLESVFDGNGNVLSSQVVGVDGAISASSFAYDPARPGQVVSMTDPRGKVWTYGYDANGYPNSVSDPLGNTATSAFDVVGRPEWSVSPLGNVAGANPDLYRTTFETDAVGRVTKVVERPVRRWRRSRRERMAGSGSTTMLGAQFWYRWMWVGWYLPSDPGSSGACGVRRRRRRELWVSGRVSYRLQWELFG